MLVTASARSSCSTRATTCRREDPVPRFFSFFLAFMGAMLGIGAVGQPDPARRLLGADEPHLVPADRLLVSPRATRGAARAWRSPSPAAAGSRLLAGVLLLGHIVGSYDLDAVLAAGDAVRAHPLLSRRARADPARRAHQERAVPVPLLAAARDGGADAGVGLPALGDDGEGRRVPARAAVAGAGRAPTLWFWLVGGAGAVTLLLGAYAAMFQHDLKGVLAYSTISHLGLITLLLGLNSPLAAVAAVFHMMNHATFKASLFMAAGIVDHETGTRDMRRLDGLCRAMPITGDARDGGQRGDGRRAAAERLPVEGDVLRRDGRSSAAAPGVRDRRCRSLATLAGVVRGRRTRCASATTSSSARRRDDLPRAPHEPPRWMRVPIELLVLACLRRRHRCRRDPIGPLLRRPRRGRSSAARCRRTASRSGTASTRRLLMSLIALAGGVARLPAACAARPARWLAARRCSSRLDGKRVFDVALASLIARGARARSRAGCARGACSRSCC